MSVILIFTKLKFIALSLILIFTSLFSQISNAASSKLKVNSLDEIKQHYSTQPFLMVIWSAKCPPCLQELRLIGKIKKNNPELNLAIVSIDDINNADENKILNDILHRTSLNYESVWAFPNNSYEQLKNTIDSSWFGELPRSYFYDKDHLRTGISGQLSRYRILKWIDNSIYF